jgi:polyisoprenoid-binding protein YceI
MTASQPTKSRGPAIVVGIIFAALILAGLAGLWYLFFRPAGPAPVSLGSLPPVAAASADPTTAASSDPAGGGSDPTAAAGASASTSSAGGIGGTWNVDTSVGSVSDGTGTFVGYRVKEELATVGAQEAVGRTAGVTGSMTIDGTTITAAEITADLTQLQSDEANRDRQLQHQGIETSTYPTATFKLTQPIELGSVPADGAVIDATATGDLTLHGVTMSVQIPLQARIDGEVITVAGSLPIQFADYGIQSPQGMIVLSVEDHGTLELQVHFSRA